MRTVRLVLVAFAVAAMATGTALALSPSWSRYLPSFMRSDPPSGDAADPGSSAERHGVTSAPEDEELGGTPPGVDQHPRGGRPGVRAGGNGSNERNDGASAAGEDPGLRRGDELGRKNTPDGEHETGPRDPPPPPPAQPPTPRPSERGRSDPEPKDGSSARDGPSPMGRAQTGPRGT